MLECPAGYINSDNNNNNNESYVKKNKRPKKANKTLFLSYIFIHKPTKRATTFLSSICMQSVCWAMCHSGNHINWYRLVVVKLLLLLLPQRIYLHNRALANTLKSTIFEQCSNNEEKKWSTEIVRMKGDGDEGWDEGWKKRFNNKEEYKRENEEKLKMGRWTTWMWTIKRLTQNPSFDQLCSFYHDGSELARNRVKNFSLHCILMNYFNTIFNLNVEEKKLIDYAL